MGDLAASRQGRCCGCYGDAVRVCVIADCPSKLRGGGCVSVGTAVDGAAARGVRCVPGCVGVCPVAWLVAEERAGTGAGTAGQLRVWW